MKTKDIAVEYNIDQKDFDQYLSNVGANCKFGFTCVTLEDDIQGHVQRYKAAKKQEAEDAEQEKQAQWKKEQEMLKFEEDKQRTLANILITSGFNFDGYKIKKYSGYISGDEAISIARGISGLFSDATDVGSSLTKSLANIRRQAIKEVKEAAYDLGCNAVIGVDFDYITLAPETVSSTGGTIYLPYVFCVTANGNAVIIEKNDD